MPVNELSDEQIIANIEALRAIRMKDGAAWGKLKFYARKLANRHNIPSDGTWEQLRDNLIDAGLIAKFIKFTH